MSEGHIRERGSARHAEGGIVPVVLTAIWAIHLPLNLSSPERVSYTSILTLFSDHVNGGPGHGPPASDSAHLKWFYLGARISFSRGNGFRGQVRPGAGKHNGGRGVAAPQDGGAGRHHLRGHDPECRESFPGPWKKSPCQTEIQGLLSSGGKPAMISVPGSSCFEDEHGALAFPDDPLSHAAEEPAGGAIAESPDNDKGGVDVLGHLQYPLRRVPLHQLHVHALA